MTGPTLFAVEELTVRYATQAGPLKALDAVSLTVRAGETLAIVGESGSGKSTVALAAMGLLQPEAGITGRILLDGRDLATMPAEERRILRGRVMSVVFQDPFTSLNPALPIGQQVAEPLVFHERMPAEAARQRAAAALAEVGLPDPEMLLSAFPHQLSGGMQQRVLIATALICNPRLLILDEPTTALDVTVESRILDLLEDIRRQRQLGILFITHNLGVVNRIADRICVLYAGRVAETGTKTDVIGRPAHPYTKGLIASLPRIATRERATRLAPIPGRFPDMTRPPPGCVFAPRCPYAEARCTSEAQALQTIAAGHEARCWKAAAVRHAAWPALASAAGARRAFAGGGGQLAVRDLAKTFSVGRSMGGLIWRRRFGIPWPSAGRQTIAAVDGVSLDIAPGEVLGLVGESGSGKSTLARLVLRLIEPSAGSILFGGRDITSLPPVALKDFRKAAQIVFQNPDSSLNPRRSVGDAIARAVKLYTDVPTAGRRAQVEELMDRVGLPRGYYDRYPHQLSGGEKQRVGIARALATGPAFVVCDEPVSALDVSVQATVLNLLADLRDEFGLSYLFISHDLSVVAHVADRIAVMYAGRLVEVGANRTVLEPPYHPYTEMLLSAVPLIDARTDRRERSATVDVAARARAGCPFHTRCPRKIGAVCETTAPPLSDAGGGHAIACHIPVEELARVPPVLPDVLAGARRDPATAAPGV